MLTRSQRRRLRRADSVLSAEARAEARQHLKGCVVIAEADALTATERKKLEKLGAVVIQKKMARQVSLIWPPSGGM